MDIQLSPGFFFYYGLYYQAALDPDALPYGSWTKFPIS